MRIQFTLRATSSSHKYKSISRLAVLCLLGILQCSVAWGAKEKTNVLFILTDDQAYDTVHAHGNNRIATPNIDSLAKQGMSFTHVFNQGSWSGAVCSPSRRMINTGRHLYQTGRGPEKLDSKTVANIKLMGETFKENGYQTFMTGKWHMSEQDWERSFDQGKSIFMHGMAHLHKGGQFNTEFVDYTPSSSAKEKFPAFKASKHSSEVIADAAVDFLTSEKSKPFMMYVGFLAPHDPRQAPQAYMGKYPGDSIELPKSFAPSHPFNQGDYYIRDEILENNPRTPYVIQKAIGEYYAMIEHTDAQIGRIIEALEASGELDNTLIVFTSDHGLAVGRHGLLGKQNQYDHSVRAPFIMQGPNVPKGKSVPGMFYLNSVFPTVVDMVGIEIPESVQAPSVRPLVKGDKDKVFDSIYGSYRHFQRMLRTDDYKLIYYPMLKKTQLFNVAEDPDELINLANLPEQQSRIENMMAKLEDWKKVVNDPLDNDNVIESYKTLSTGVNDSNKRPKAWPALP